MSTLETSHDHPESPLHAICQCKPDGFGRRVAVLDIREGSIHALVCVHCDLDLGIEPELLSSAALAVTVGRVVEHVSMDPTGDYPGGQDVWYRLTAHEEVDSVEQFAALVDRLGAINPSPAVLDALLDEAAGGGL